MSDGTTETTTVHGTLREVAVLGAGGVGGLVGALLARTGDVAVTFVARDETVRSLRERGLRVRSEQLGDVEVAVRATARLDDPVDVLLVAVKATGLRDALDRVAPEVLGDAVVVPLLNGVEHLDVLRARYGSERVVPAVIRVEATRVAPGEIVHGSPFVEIDLAPGDAPTDAVDSVRDLLARAGITVRLRADEAALVWAKLSFLAPLALLTTRHRATIGEVRTAHRDELEALVAEVAAVATASCAPSDPAASLTLYDRFPAAARSSMERDAEAGRPLEVDAIGGAVVRAAERHGVSAPLTARLVAELS
ncbi:ketopantoate reductase family protein [Oerskovia sp. NPDC057915]|uniref:ketopantoate reductase family protein n=1 Tax=Oerskovia sp. NPDC057915 TaxID=3346280 RepID=UPI0036D7EC02